MTQHFYRYRPASELSYKELRYSEIFFAAPSEVNDPFDGQTYFEFPADQERWRRVLSRVWEQAPQGSGQSEIAAAAKVLASLCPCDFAEAGGPEFSRKVSEYLLERGVLAEGVEMLTQRLSQFLRTYRPSATYSCSFSRVGTESLMWSHYADNHSGLCFIYKPIEGLLHQDPISTRSGISRRSYTMHLGEAFPFRPVVYGPRPDPLDAFLCFPEEIARPTSGALDWQDFHAESHAQQLHKERRWEYEQEERLILPQPRTWLAGPIDFTSDERLFQHHPDQLVGIILGARASDATRHRVNGFLDFRAKHMHTPSREVRYMFGLVLFQAKLAHLEREVLLEPLKYFGTSNTITPDDSAFQSRFEAWSAGEAITMRGSSGTKGIVP